MIPYILNVTVITTICFLFYKLFLQKETFYRLNRWMLMGSLAIAFVLPVLPVPQQLSWRAVRQDMKVALPANKQSSVAVQAQPSMGQTRSAMGQAQPVAGSGLADRVKFRHRRSGSTEGQAAAPVVSVTPVSGAPVTPALASPAASTEATGAASTEAPVIMARESISFSRVFSFAAHWLFYVYLFGVLLFGFHFLLQLAVLLYQSYANPVIWDGRFRIVETGGNRAPCSFGNTIFINPAAYDWETYNQILIHEKTHVSGRH
ncbi:MAG TPA: hypothetical protein VL727_24405, partial [Puia sp.]|nr:hypothetical protein [Puia sp.]